MSKKTTGILLIFIAMAFAVYFAATQKNATVKKPYVSKLALPPKTGIGVDTIAGKIKTVDFHYKKALITKQSGTRIDKSITALAKKERARKVYGFDDHNIKYHKNELHRKISNPVIFQITFDNDIFDETDYYYTNGLCFSLVTPVARRSFLSKILVGNRNADIVLAGFSLRQNMYTATNPETEVILKGDHPFAGYLIFGHFMHTVDLKKKLYLFSEINLGVIGPASLAASIQRGVHEKYPAGWDYQINNDVIVNYTLKAEKNIIQTNRFELNAAAGLNTGTLYDDISAGIYLRTGSFTPFYKGISLYGNKRLQYWFFLKSNLKAVAYNATLQGGMFSNSPYTIPDNEINRFVFTASAGLSVFYNSVGLQLENFYQSPEFKGAMDFRWGRINLILRF